MVELLAPAGNQEALKGAINAGADAVYLGGSRFGARAYAENFSEEELLHGIRFAHLFGKKIFLTVNTLVKENEFDDLFGYIRPFYEEGLDGVIVQDIGVLSAIRSWFPELKIHVSTQMTITGVYGAELLKKMGAARIVPARELSLQEIAEIKQKTGLEIETFIHGAMCYCYSGQCLFSSMLGERSGNRGRCAQPCRLGYTMTVNGETSGECFPLSLKDLCTVDHIPEFIEAGIDSFKIEGRMKKPEYVAGVTAVYRKVINRFYEGRSGKDLIDSDERKNLHSLYIRAEVQDGYYFRQNGKEMVTLHSSAYRSFDEKILSDIRKAYLSESRKLPVEMEADFRIGECARITMSCGEKKYTAKGDEVSEAKSKPVEEAELAARIVRLGDTFFEAVKVSVKADPNIFYPLGKINALRRKTCEGLSEVLTGSFKRAVYSDGNRRDIGLWIESIWKSCRDDFRMDYDEMPMEETSHICAVSLQNPAQLEAVSRYPFYKRIYLPGEMLLSPEKNFWTVLYKLQENGADVIISLPYIIRRKDREMLEEIYRIRIKKKELFQGIQIRSVDGAGFLFEKKEKGGIYADAGFYSWNLETMRFWSGFVKKFCLPLELTKGEQKILVRSYPCEKIIYGRIPLMLTANCIAKTAGKCAHGKGAEAFLTDRYHMRFPVKTDCAHCMNIIYNSVPLSLHSKAFEAWKESDLRLDFTTESAADCDKILGFFESTLLGPAGEIRPPYQEYTTGHEKRSVE